MLIEYRLEFLASGLTITQRIDMDGSAPPAKTDTPIDAQVKPDAPVNKPLAQPAIQGAELPEHIIVPAATAAIPVAQTKDDPKSGGGVHESTDPGGGIHDSTDPGGGGPTSGVVIAFGPIVMLPSRGPGGGVHGSTDPGGGVHPSTDPGGAGGK
jgi:hypothetical protein